MPGLPQAVRSLIYPGTAGATGERPVKTAPPSPGNRGASESGKGPGCRCVFMLMNDRTKARPFPWFRLRHPFFIGHICSQKLNLEKPFLHYFAAYRLCRRGWRRRGK